MSHWKVKNTLSVATLSRIVDRLQKAGCDCQVKVEAPLMVHLFVQMPMNRWRNCTPEQLESLQETFLKDLALDRGALQVYKDVNE